MTRIIVPFHSTACRRVAPLFVLLLAGLVACGSSAAAPPPTDDKTVPEAPPDPEVVNLEANDGLQMEATYYGSIKGKEAVPVILLHGWKGSRTDMDGLALALQAQGFAVIAPDLRGHGKSLQLKAGDTFTTIDPAAVKKPDMDSMVRQDMQAVKKFLREKNNDAKLNIEKLCIVGAEMEALLAMNWAVYDWHAPLLPNYKQGQDVKALVLISPPMNLLGSAASAALADAVIQKQLSILILVGAKGPSKALDDAQSIDKRLARLRPRPPVEEKDIKDSQDLFFIALKDTSLQGPTILKQRELLPTVTAAVGQFIDWRLVNKKFPWAVRKSPLGT